jgi:hypothetical protein
MKLLKTSLIFSFILVLSSSFAWAEKPPRNDRKGAIRTVGDITQITPFMTSLMATHRLDDNRGQKQLIYSCGVTSILTEVSKRTFKIRRPDGSDTKSFPSGHTSFSFCRASFAHQRYGFDTALPLYAIASYTAYSRVWANRHRPLDVIAGAVLAYAVSEVMVDAYDGHASLNTSDYFLGTGITVAYDYWRHDRQYFDFQESLKPSRNDIVLSAAINTFAADYLPKGDQKILKYQTYFSANQGGGLNFNIELRF